MAAMVVPVHAATPHLSTGFSHTLAIGKENPAPPPMGVRTLAWGSDSRGQLGTGTALYRPAPDDVLGVPPLVRLTAKFETVAGIDGTGKVWIWGGIVPPNRSTSDPARPGILLDLPPVTAVDLGSNGGAALTPSGDVWAWGTVHAALGTYLARPVWIDELGKATRVARGGTEIVTVRADGTVWQVGGEDMGQFGAVVNLGVPVQVPIGVPVSEVYAYGGRQWAAVSVSGQVYAWGCWESDACVSGRTGTVRLLSGLASPRSLALSAIQLFALRQAGDVVWIDNVHGSSGTFSAYGTFDSGIGLAYGGGTAFVRRSGGSIQAGGDNTYGQLGNNTIGGTAVNVLVTLPPGTSANAVAATSTQAFSILSDGSLHGWGSDQNGALTGDSRFGITVPRLVDSFTTGDLPVKVAAGYRTSFRLHASGNLYAWGANGFGELAMWDYRDRSVPTLVPTIDSVSDIAAGYGFALAIRFGELYYTLAALPGSPTFGVSASFNAIPFGLGPTGATRVFARKTAQQSGFALHGAGSLYGIGYDFNNSGVFGQFLDPTSVYPFTGDIAGAPPNITDFAVADHALAVSGGAVWSWGMNGSAQLGRAASAPAPTPQLVAGLSGVTAVAAGACHSLALKSDGTVWSWGCNAKGNLGDPAVALTVNRVAPAQVPNLSGIVKIVAGRTNSFAIRSDSLVFAWGESSGDDEGGTLGDGALVTRRGVVLVSREDRLGTADGDNWYMDLDTTGVNLARPTSTNKTVTTDTKATANAQSQTVTAAAIARAPDVNTTKSVYVIGRVPANFLSLVGALPPPGSAAAFVYTRAKAAGDLVLVQLTATGWSVVTGSISAYSSGTLSASTGATSILTNTNTTLIPGSQFCIGYGGDPNAMLANGTIAEVFALPGATATSNAYPCLVAGTYLVGPASSVAGQSVTFTATVIGVAPTGSVKLMDGANPTALVTGDIAAGNTKAIVSVPLSSSSLPAKAYSLSAAFTPSGGVNPPSASRTIAHVRQAQPTLAVTGPGSAVQGASVTVTATLSGAATPGGTVQFKDAGSNLGGPVNVSGTSASFTTAGLTLGVHPITAVYSGDDLNLGATSAAALSLSITAPVDTTPNAFSFPSQANVPLTTPITSAAATIGGINAAASISVTGGAYSINCTGSYTTVATTITNGQSVCVRHTSAATGGQGVTTTLTVGGVSATFTSVTIATPTGALQVSPTTLPFGGQSMNTTSPAQPVMLTNTGGTALTIGSVTASAHFAVTHACVTLAAGASCTASVTFTPGAEGNLTGTLAATSSSGNHSATLTGRGERSLVTHYYRSILLRDPDADGKAYWEREAARVTGLGASVDEVWFAMAMSFFFSPEYSAFNRDDLGFTGDLYRTFFNRAPDAGGLGYWSGLLAQGMPREVLLASFMFSAEFANFTAAIFGGNSARAEVNTVTDFYRGILSRLPDSSGFAYWLGQFRLAQCTGPEAVYTEVEGISSAYMNGPEYAARNRTHAQFVGDLYNAFLRRGGDLDGVKYWIEQLASGARTRQNVRQAFITTPEFSQRVAAIIGQGCF